MKSEFFQYVPPQAIEFLQKLTDRKMEATIIGGTVRDFYLGRPCKNDFDIEIRTNLEILKELFSTADVLKFEVLKINFEGMSFELSLPRKEKYGEGFHHDNFEAILDENLPPIESVKRRDFSINAMGMKYVGGDFVLIDPLNGLKDLKGKKLVPCSDDFYRDPVRFLRGIRFKVLLGFELELKQFKPVNHPFYFRSEAEKSGNILAFISEYLSSLELSSDLSQHVKNGLVIEKFDQIKKLIFLNDEERKTINKLSEIKFNKGKITIPLKISEILNKSDLEKGDLLESLEGILSLGDELFFYLSQNGYTDITDDQRRYFKNAQVDFSKVKPESRKCYRWAKLLNLEK